MKSTGSKAQRHRTPGEATIRADVAITLLAGLLLGTLPFAVNPGGFDQFRLPKDLVFGIGAAVIGGVFFAANGIRRFWHWISWESLLLLALLYVLFHGLLVRPDTSGWSVVWMAAAGVLVFALSRGVPLSSHPALWLVFAAALGLNALFALLQFYGRFPLFTRVGGDTLIDPRRTASGLIGDVNTGAFLFGLSALMMLYPMIARKKTGLRIFAGVVFVLNLVGLIVTQTINAMLAFGAVFALWVAFHAWWLIRTHKNLRKAVLLGLAVLVVSFGVVLTLFITRGAENRMAAALSAALKGDLNVATSGRYPVYQITWRMIKDKPILGRGLNSFGTDFFHFRADTDMSRLTMINQPGAFREAHNDYLQIWEELGIIGLLLFLALMVLPCVEAWPKAKKSPDPKTVYWTGMLCLATVFTAISCLAFFPMRISISGTAVVLLLAGLRGVAFERESDARQPSRLDTGWKWRTAASLAVMAVVAYQNVQRLRADSEIGIAAYVLEDAYARSLSEQHKRVWAETALARLRHAEALNPDFYENYNLQGSANMLMSNHEEAARQYERAARYLPSPEVFTNEAVALMAGGEKGRAIELLEKALRYNPSYANAARALEYLKGSQGAK